MDATTQATDTLLPARDAFLLYNEQENGIWTLAQSLEMQNIRTFYWRRDIPYGTEWESVEAAQLRTAGVIVLLLGKAGWGPTHLRLAREVQALGRPIVPVLLAEPPPDALNKDNGLFTRLRYVDLREPNPAALQELVKAIRAKLRPAASAESTALPEGDAIQNAELDEQFDAVIDVFINGDQPARYQEVHLLRTSPAAGRAALAARLRAEIAGRFSLTGSTRLSTAIRDSGEVPLIRAWLLSALAWCGAEDPATRELLLRHLDPQVEPYHNARFWTLANLYQQSVSYLPEALSRSAADPAPQVAVLARVMSLPEENLTATVFAVLRQQLESNDPEVAWPVLRALRVVAVPVLAPAVCQQFVRAADNSPFGYDVLYALVSPPMAQAAAEQLLGPLGLSLAAVVRRVVAVARNANAIAWQQFAGFLRAFDQSEVRRELLRYQQEPGAGPTAGELLRHLTASAATAVAGPTSLPGYQADTSDATHDQLGIEHDVQTLTAVLLARDVRPPLAIGLFGDWGAGKSFFMRAMRRATQQLTERARTEPTGVFCTNVVSIEFNAWHYVDTNLWASLVSFILEQLDAHVSPPAAPGEELVAARQELQLAQSAVTEAETEKRRVEAQITERRQQVVLLQQQRESRQLTLGDLRWQDVSTQLTDPDRQAVQQAAAQLGLPQALASWAQFTQTVAESATLWARGQALLRSLVSFQSLTWLLGLLVTALLLIPLLLHWLRQHLPPGALDWGAGRIAQFVALLTALTGILQGAGRRVSAALHLLAAAKEQAERRLAQKRLQPTTQEAELQREIDQLATQEQTAAVGLSAAEARVAALEEHLRALTERQSLAYFLRERLHSADYQQHLGLISTIRRDFEHLANRLQAASLDPAASGAIDRIVLYIDDLDRCPMPKVVEVLQAIHLLLAHELFVVVVGVDPRWLVRSLQHSPLPLTESDPDEWQTSPQRYLEKIFQIPFCLRPMTAAGYRQLTASLLTPAGSAPEPVRVDIPLATGPQASVVPTPVAAQAVPVDATSPDDVATTSDHPAASLADELALATPVSLSPVPIALSALIIQPWESAFAGELFTLLPTPRTAKRFTNLYRLLKAQVEPNQLARFEGSAAQPGEFQAAMLLLAVLLGCPAEATSLFQRLRQQAHAQTDLTAIWPQVLASSALTGGSRLVSELRRLVSRPQFPQAAAVYLDWLPRVARFSFELGHTAFPDSSE